jgi:predicted PurR-regulated permease PerM
MQMEAIGIILLFAIFFLGLVVFYIFLQYLNAVREMERQQDMTARQLSQIQTRIEELSPRRSGDEMDKVQA